MSQNNSVRFCPKCGARLGLLSTVCIACGTVLDGKEKVVNTPTQKQGSAPVQSSGTSHESTNSFYAGPAGVRALKGESEAKSDIKRHALILFIIAATLCVIFFVPFVSVRTQYNEYFTYDVKFTPLDLVKMRIKSSSYLTSADLQLTEEYQEYEVNKRSIGNLATAGVLTESQLQSLKKYTKSALVIYFMSSGISAKFNLTLALVFSAVYIIAALLGVILSVCALIANNSEKTPEKQRALGGAQKTLLFIISFIPAYLITLMHGAHFGLDSEISGFGGLGVRMAWGAAVAVIIFVAVMAHVCKRRLGDARGEKGEIRFVVITRVVALACVTVAMLSMFIACLSVKTASAYGNKKSTPIKVADTYAMNYTDVYYYTQQVNTTTDEEFINSAERVAEGVESSRSVLEIFYVSAFKGGDVSDIYSFISVIQILLALSFGLVAKKLVNVILSKSKLEKPQFSLFLAALFSLVYLGLCIAVSAICYNNLGIELGKYVNMRLGASPIFAVIFIFGVVVSLLITAPKSKEIEYDKPDVSCAPYVV